MSRPGQATGGLWYRSRTSRDEAARFGQAPNTVMQTPAHRQLCRSAAGFCALLLFAVAGPPAVAAEPVSVTVDDDTLVADLALAGGITAELTIAFEDVVGLTANSFDIDVSLVNPLDYQLLSRLPQSSGGLPTAFPVLLSIEPRPSQGLSFSGIVRVELYTHVLDFDPGAGLRLFSAEAGEPFRDITVSHGGGSYRSGGTKGNFSEFLLAVDTRPPLVAAGDKLDYLRQILDGSAGDLEAEVYQALSDQLATVESAVAATSLVAAVSAVEAFDDQVRAFDDRIPNVWSAGAPLDNVAGRLRAAAGTLRFSLTLAINAQ